MNRFTVERGGAKDEPPQRKTRQQDRLSRWTDKVFVIPSAVAEVIAKIGHRSVVGPSQAETKPPTQRRHRGFYVWRPSVGPDGKPYALGGVFRLIEEIDPTTGEIKAPGTKGKDNVS